MKLLFRSLLILLFCAGSAFAVLADDIVCYNADGTVKACTKLDASGFSAGTFPCETGTTLPSTCTPSRCFYDTDATTQKWWGCDATDTWKPLGVTAPDTTLTNSICRWDSDDGTKVKDSGVVCNDTDECTFGTGGPGVIRLPDGACGTGNDNEGMICQDTDDGLLYCRGTSPCEVVSTIGNVANRISALNWSTVPDSSGNVYAEPYSIQATNDVWQHMIWVFNDTSTRDCLFSSFQVPSDYNSGAEFLVYWSSTVTTNDVVWDVDYRAISGNDTESYDQTGNQESLTVTDTAPSAANEQLIASLDATDSNFVANDTVEVKLCRDGAASDTLVGKAMTFGFMFGYLGS